MKKILPALSLAALALSASAQQSTPQYRAQVRKHERLLRAVERRGGNELDAHWQK